MEAGVKRRSVVDQVFGDNKAPMAEVLAADLGRVILDARDMWGRADGRREVEKRPILEAGRELDAFFKDMMAPLVKGREHLQGMADTYTRQKAAEARAKAQREAEEARIRAEAEREKAEAAKTAGGASRAEGRAEALDAKADAAEAVAASSEADLVRARVDGVSASAKGVWRATILDYVQAVSPLGAVGPYLKRDAFEAALNSMARIQGAAAVWPGVSFTQDVKATFRR
jgi:hypothetical protein